jgi:toxin ParE1/3/4
MGHRLSPQAQADIDDIAYYVFVESGSLEVADRLIEFIYLRFLLLGTHPRAGRPRDDLREGVRTFPAGQYVIGYRLEGDNVLVLRVLHGNRDVDSILSHDSDE